MQLPFGLFAQTCNTPPAGGESCDLAPEMSCNLDGYQGTSVGYTPGPAPPDFCGIIENNQWFNFVVDELPVIIQIIPSNCTNNEGLQAGLYTTSDCTNLNQESNCASFGNMNTLTVNSSSASVPNPTLQIGDVAYLMIDGFEGDMCDFEINVVSGILPDELAQAEDASICPGTPIQLNATGSATGPNIFYTWTTTDGNIVSGADQMSPTIDQIGSYTLEVLDVVSCCIDEVTVEVTQNTDLPEINFDPVTPLNCQNLSTSISTNMDVPSNYTYSWDTGDGNITSATNGEQIEINQGGTYNVTVENTTTGCSNIGFISVTNDDEVPSVMATVNDDLDCQTTQTNVNALSPDSDLIYAWTGPNGFTSNLADPTVNAGGLYTIVVTAQNGCTADAQITVNQDADQPDVSAAVSDQLTCINTTVDLEGASSTSGVSYSWSGPNGFTSTQAIANTNAAGLYTLTVSLANGCTNEETIEVFQDIEVPAISLPEPMDLDCQRTSTTLQGSSSTTGVTFNWTGPDGFTDIVAQPSVSQAGTYTLTVIATNGCESSLSVTVDQTADLPAVDAGTDEELTCTIEDVTVGGTNSETGADITYTWTDENGMTLGNDMNLNVSTAGTYTLTVFNATTGCSNAEDVIVTENVETPQVDPGTELTLSCNQNTVTSNGTNSSSGPDFTYEWSDEDGNVIATTVNADFSATGIYTLEVTDNTNGCSDVATLQVIQDANTPVANSEAIGEITCINSDVELNATGSSTGSNINYEWLDANDMTISNDMVVSVSQPGTYTLVVTDQDNGCSSINPVTVQENTLEPIVVFEPVEDLDCQKTEVTLDASNSTSQDGYTAQWFDVDGNEIASSIMTNVQEEGTYSLVLTDNVNGCTATADLTVEDIGENPIAEIAGMAEITCDEEIIELNIGNSDTGLSYEWFDENGNSLGTGTTLDVDQAGEYTMFVNDASNGCTSSASVTIEENKILPEAVTVAPEELTCITTTVTLDASQSSANGSIEFEWMDPNGTVIGTEEFANVNVTGMYQLRVTDTDNGCEDLMTVMVEENVDPPIFTIETPTVITCDESTSVLTFDTPDIDNSGATWYDANGTSLTTDSYLEVTTAGVYELEVVNNANGCTTVSQVEVFEDVTAPEIEPLVPEIIDCINTEVSLGANVTNNISTTQYTWSDAAGTTLGTENDLMATTAGEYILIVENTSNGCTVETSITVQEDTEAPQAIIDFDGDVLNCNVETINVDGDDSSGNSDLSYRWEDQISNTIGTSSDLIISNSGTYTLNVIQESNGCVGTAEIIIEEDYEEPNIEINSVGILTCLEEIVEISSSASGANNDFTYQWTDANNGIVSGGNTSNPQINTPGDYTLVVTDQTNGCSSSRLVAVEQDVDLPEAVAAANEVLDCITESVILSGFGSSEGPDINYAWTGVNILNGEDTANPEVSAAGMYNLTVTNTLTGCKNQTSVEVEENTERPTGAVTASNNPTCHGITNGELNVVEVIGGTEPYLYALNDPNNYSPNPHINNLPSGEYQIFIQDASGCEWDTSLFILDPIEVTVDLGPDLLIELGESVNLNANTTGNVKEANWTSDKGTVPNGFLSLEVSPLENTEYEVVVTNEHGCTSLDNILVKVETNRNVYFPTAFSPNGDGVNDFFTVFSDDLVIKVIKLQIFDRWGTQLYTKSEFDPNFEDSGWDGYYKGTRMQPGVFVYHAVVEFLDGKQGTYHGDFTILE